MKSFYRFIQLFFLISSLNYAQKVETNFMLDLPITNFSSDVKNYSNIGVGIDLGFRFFIVDQLQIEAKPGLFISEGDFHFGGTQFSLLARYEIWKTVWCYTGMNWKYSSLSVSGMRNISIKNDDFTELVFGARLGLEVIGINLSYFHPLNNDIGTIGDYNATQDLFLDGTVQVGLEIKLFTIKDLFPTM